MCASVNCAIRSRQYDLYGEMGYKEAVVDSGLGRSSLDCTILHVCLDVVAVFLHLLRLSKILSDEFKRASAR